MAINNKKLKGFKSMYLTGLADEAATDIDGQIRVTQKLGWKYIEARNVDGKNICDLTEDEFKLVCTKLEKSNIKINCVASAIANWEKEVTDPFEITIKEVQRAIPRMQRLGTKLVRIMSYAILRDNKGMVLKNQMEKERFRRLNEICRMFIEAGITPVHENCMNYGGMGWTYTLKLLENVPGLRLVFDIGNPPLADDFTKDYPYPKQSAWEFYSHIKEHIIYVHIKDSYFDKKTNKEKYTFPGEGQANLKKILKDLFESGYNGGFSIEPHMAVVFHDKSVHSESKYRFNNYLEYGRRVTKLLKDIGYSLE